MSDRNPLRFILPLIPFLIPVNICIMGNWYSIGLQWIFFRCQTADFGLAWVTLLSDLRYLYAGIASQDTSIALLLWSLGTGACILFLIMMIRPCSAPTGCKCPAAVLLITAALFFLISDCISYGPFLNGPVGSCIPVGIGVMLAFGGYLIHRENPEPAKRMLNKGAEFIRHHLPVFLFIGCFILYNITSSIAASGDTAPAALLPYSILYHGTVNFDPFRDIITTNTGISYAFTEINGSWYSVFPVVLPVLLLPAYACQQAVLGLLGIPVNMAVINLTAHVMSAGIAALSCSILYLALRELVHKKTALVSVLIYAFATSTWSIGSQALWQHGLIELFLSLILFLVIRNEHKPSTANIIALGIIAGLMVFARPADSLLVFPVLACVLIFSRTKILYFLSAAFLSGLPFLIYNIAIFGNVLGGTASEIAIFRFDGGFIVNYLGLLVAPNKGLLVYSPVLLLSVMGFFMLGRRENTSLQRTLRWFGPILLLEILIYSFFGDWGGGYSYGPRYLTGILPVLAAYLAVFLEELQTTKMTGLARRCMTIGIIIIVTISVIIQGIGVFYFPNITDRSIGSEPAWDLNNSQIIQSFWDALPNTTHLYLVLIPPLPTSVIFATPTFTGG
ncbi:MAG: glycosyltransferase family 39 protein [Methanoregula sp.]|jgi:hypothetical protein